MVVIAVVCRTHHVEHICPPSAVTVSVPGTFIRPQEPRILVLELKCHICMESSHILQALKVSRFTVISNVM